MKRKRLKSTIQPMPLVDHFASLAMQGMLSSPGNWWEMDANGAKHYASTFTEYARLAYSAAEALVAERDRLYGDRSDEKS